MIFCDIFIFAEQQKVMSNANETNACAISHYLITKGWTVTDENACYKELSYYQFVFQWPYASKQLKRKSLVRQISFFPNWSRKTVDWHRQVQTK